ncbi:hypothetical protein QJS10_CPB11g01506 [Acorus calamus]|uniref:Hexosyltransferase n=1 Tax=Acorus calamus TaxID=4465 RepID=A0AAV9DUJ9_ACOCL|nr:hypothetical protein QJS10_CPB11g01506 [Acorus calamus]
MPKPRRLSQALAVAAIVFFTCLQFLPASHVRDPSDPSRSWRPLDPHRTVTSRSGEPSEEGSNVIVQSDSGKQGVHLVAWIDCLDLRVLAVLANSTISKSRSPGNIHFHFFIPEGEDEKLSYYKLKVVFPHSNLKILGQKEVKDHLKLALSKDEVTGPFLHEIAPFIIPSVHPSLSRFIYISPYTIVKGNIEELFGVDMGEFAVALVEDNSKRLGDHINFDVLNAVQRTAAKPWISRKPYDGNALVPDTSVLLIDANKLERDIPEAILWWNKVLETGRESNPSNLSIALAIYGKYHKLPSTWKVSSPPLTTGEETNLVRFDGPKKALFGSSTFLQSQISSWAPEKVTHRINDLGFYISYHDG